MNFDPFHTWITVEVKMIFVQGTITVIYSACILQGDFWQSSSGIDLLQACFEASGVLKGIYVIPRLGANYF